MTSLLPLADDGLELYAAHVAELVLELREEGHILSPMDQHLIEQWWDAGYPLEAVLRVVRVQGPRLKARKRPPRGLPLSSMRRAVEKVATRVQAARLGAAVQEPPPPAEGLGELIQATAARRAEAVGSQLEALAEAEQALRGLQAASPGAEEQFAALLGVGRRYYLALWVALPVEERARRRQEVVDQLPPAARALPAEALDATVQQLALRALRAEDPLFEPRMEGIAP